jgi:hypothetical protein
MEKGRFSKKEHSADLKFNACNVHDSDREFQVIHESTTGEPCN